MNTYRIRKGDSRNWVVEKWQEGGEIITRGLHVGKEKQEKWDTINPVGHYPTARDAARRLLDVEIAQGWPTDGWTGDGTSTNTTGVGSAVIKFADGMIIGWPYVSSAAHASNANDRGVRIQFSEDMTTHGMMFQGFSSAISGFEINAASGGANQKTVAADYTVKNRIAGVLFDPVTLTGGTSYDFVRTFSTSTSTGTLYTMGEAEGSLPADVLACRFQGCASLTGATPGSYTADTSQLPRFSILLDDNPAIAGGGAQRWVGGVPSVW